MQNGSFLILLNKSRDKVFLILRSDFPVWVLTGGGIEPKESPKSAALRETYEESKFKVKLIKSIGCYRQLDRQNRVIKTDHIFEGRIISGNYQPEYDGCQGRWFHLNHLPPNMILFTKKIIDDTINSKKVFNKYYYHSFSFVDIKLLLLGFTKAFRYFKQKYFIR